MRKKLSKKTNAFRLTVISSAFALSTLSANVQGAMYGGGPAESWTIGEIAALSGEVTANIAAFGVSFATQMQLKFEQIISAIAVATKQEALSASVVADGTREASAQLVNAVSAQRQSDQVTRAYLSFSPLTGQGFDPCGTLAKNKTLDRAFTSAKDQAKEVLQKLDVSPGKVFTASSSQDPELDRIRQHLDSFCTADEAKAGLCTESELPGGDLNAALLFEPAAPGSLKAQARQAYIQNVVGSPIVVSPNLRQGGGLNIDQVLSSVTRQSSFMSIPAYSLASIDAANTQTPEFDGKSPNEVLSLRVNQYFGGNEAQAWSGAMAAQSERGLLVEHAKMSGLQAWVRQREYEQTQRIEANLAALVLLTNERLQDNLTFEHNRARNVNVRGQVQ